MRLVWLIARTYFFSRKNPSAINIITGISLAGYAVGAMALLVLLSALNGFETVIFGSYQYSDADLKVVPVEGKVFELSSKQLKSISSNKNIMAYYQCLEDKAIVKFGEQQMVALVKGIDTVVYKTLTTDSLIIAGNGQLQSVTGERSFIWLSEGLVYKLGIHSDAAVVDVMVPDRLDGSVSQPLLNQESLVVSSMVRLGEDLNGATAMLPLSVAQMLFGRDTEISSLEIRAKRGKETELKLQLSQLLGPKYRVLNRHEQHQTMYKMFNTEKWVSFALLAFILLLISFNLYGAIRMMVMDKKGDLTLLSSLGLYRRNLRLIFIVEGLLVSVVGSVIGLVLGFALVWLQNKYGFVQTQASFSMAYPVRFAWPDVWLVLGLNAGLGFLSGMGSLNTAFGSLGVWESGSR